MPSPITRAKSNRRSRRLSGQQRPMQREIPIEILTASATSTQVALIFNQFVTLKGIPQYPNNNGALPTAASLSNPTTLVLTYPAGPEATGITVPSEDPAVRNSSGGYVTPIEVDV